MTNTNFIKFLKNTATDSSLVNAWSDYLVDIGNLDDTIFDMDSFDGIMDDKSPLEIVNSIADNFNTNHNYFQFNGYGNAVSSDYINDFIDFISLAKYLEENECELFNRYKKHMQGNNC